MNRISDYSNLGRENLKQIPSKKPQKTFRIMPEFQNAEILITQEELHFVAAYKHSNGNFATGATKSMAVGNLILKNSEFVD